MLFLIHHYYYIIIIFYIINILYAIMYIFIPIIFMFADKHWLFIIFIISFFIIVIIFAAYMPLIIIIIISLFTWLGLHYAAIYICYIIISFSIIHIIIIIVIDYYFSYYYYCYYFKHYYYLLLIIELLFIIITLYYYYYFATVIDDYVIHFSAILFIDVDIIFIITPLLSHCCLPLFIATFSYYYSLLLALTGFRWLHGSRLSLLFHILFYYYDIRLFLFIHSLPWRLHYIYAHYYYRISFHYY